MVNILLLSGGMDSTLIYYIEKNIDEYVFFNYGQKQLKQERNAIKKLNVKYKEIKINKLNYTKNGFIQGRNLTFLIELRELYIDKNIVVFIGSNKDDVFPDNNTKFMKKVESILNASYIKNIKIITPLSNTTKKTISKSLSQVENVSPYWCYSGTETPCGICKSCKELKKIGEFKKWIQ